MCADVDAEMPDTDSATVPLEELTLVKSEVKLMKHLPLPSFVKLTMSFYEHTALSLCGTDAQ